MTGDSNYEKILKSSSESKGKVKNMCEVAERLTKIGKEEGRVEERNKMIEKMLRKGKTPEEIADLFDIDLGEIKNVQRLSIL